MATKSIESLQAQKTKWERIENAVTITSLAYLAGIVGTLIFAPVASAELKTIYFIQAAAVIPLAVAMIGTNLKLGAIKDELNSASTLQVNNGK